MTKVKVEPWTEAGAVGIEVEQLTSFGWQVVLDTPTVGTFPNYTTTYTVTTSGTSDLFRYRWETGAGQFTSWLTPSLVHTPTSEQTERLTSAIIFKAVRFLKLPEAPFGHSGITEWGVAMVRPDFEVSELLYGLSYRNYDLDLTSLVTVDDVVRVGLQMDPDDFPATSEPDVQRAIDSAVSWVADRVLYGIGIA